MIQYSCSNVQFWTSAHAVEPSWVALNASRGNEDLNLKLFMRFSAIITELITLVPAIIWFAFIKYPSNKNYVQKVTKRESLDLSDLCFFFDLVFSCIAGVDQSYSTDY